MEFRGNEATEMRSGLLGLFGLLATLLVSLYPTINAQVFYGALVGAITDPSGAGVPGVDVTILNQQTNQTRNTSTNASGGYTFSNVLPGLYRLEAEATGFQAYAQTGVSVTINTVTRIDVELRVGQITEKVTVSTAAGALQSDKADVHIELNTKELTELPLGGYRNYQSLINLTPGATPARFQNSINDTPGRSLTTNVNGTARNANNTRLDGALNKMNIISSHTLYVPPSESIETVNISTNAFDAEQGMAGGAAVTVVTKSGTNEFHGSLFGLHNNSAFQAKNFFFRGDKTPKSLNTIYGFTLGGPLVRNKLFFFGSWEGLRERNNFSSLYTVATADQREGDFGALRTNLYDPLTGAANGSGRALFPNAVIPLARQSQISRKMQALAPLPNLGGTNANYFRSGTQQLDRDNYDVKLNWNRTDRHTIWGKYSRMDAFVNCDPSLGEGGGTGLCIGGKPGKASTLVQLGTLGHTWVLQPNLLFDGNMAYSRLAQNIRGPKIDENFGLTTLGIPGTNGPDLGQGGQPGFVVTGYESLGDANASNPAFRTDAVYTYTTNFSWTRGSHDMRFGFESVRFHQNDWQPNITGGPRGQFNFGGGVTALSGGSAPNQFNSYAAFLLGLPQAMSKALQFYSPQTAREWQFGGFFQDRRQLNQSLTLTLGLRWEHYPIQTRSHQGFERYDPLTNQVFIGRRGNNPDTVGIDVSKRLFAPRVGLVYRLGPSTVIRSGYGISFDPTTLSGAIQRPYPVVVGKQFPGVNSFQPYRPLAQGIPPVEGPDISSGIIPLPIDAQTMSVASGKFPRGYIQSWNFVVERKLPLELVGSAGYVGTKSIRAMAFLDINAGRPGLGVAGQALFASFWRTATTSMLNPAFASDYHSLQATINRRFTRGLFVKGSYTFSKAINSVDDSPGGLAFNTPTQLSRNRALAGYDRAHVLQASWIYELPFGPGKALLAGGGLVSALLRDWQINGIFAVYSGSPFTVSAATASLNAPANTQTADQVKPVVAKLGGIGIGNPWFDTTAFQSVTAARFGNTGRNILRGPGVVEVNAGLFRNIRLSERFTLQFRGEAFNLSNTPHFDNPAANVSTSTNFGAITSAQQDQRTIRFSLRMAF